MDTEGRCIVCGNDYDKPLEVQLNGKTYTFDCFECAIHALAPHCGECGIRIIGHGVETAGVIYCSAHCAREAGAVGLVDRSSQVIMDIYPDGILG